MQQFAGVDNFLSLLCPELQKLLKLIYVLTRKGRVFYGELSNNRLLMKLKDGYKNLQPCICLTTREDFTFILIPVKFVTNSALHQIQNGQLRLIVYTSKTMPKVTQNYSITESEFCGLAINIASDSHLMKRFDSDTMVDHLALTHITKSKSEPATTRIKRLLEVMSSYTFSLYYLTGEDIILSDFLPRMDR